MTPALPALPPSLWHDRAFVLFWLARSVSIAGSTITAVVLPILVFQITGSALQTALLSTLELLPYFVFGLFAGALADRIDRRRLMIGCELVNGVLLGSIPLAAVLGVLSLPQIFLVAPLSMTTYVWFDAANFGALPTLVGRERIAEAYSIVAATETIIGIVGPSIGGVLATTIGAAFAVSIDALSFVVSAVALLLVPRAFNAARTPVNEPTPLYKRVAADIGEGLRFLWQQHTVRALTLLGFGVSLTSGAVFGLLVVYGVRALGLTADDPRIGLLFTAGAIGGLLASLALPRLLRRISAPRITLYGLLIDPILLVGVAFAPSFPVGLALYGCWRVADTLIVINGITLRQTIIPEHLQSRVNTTARMIAWGGAPFGAAIGGVLAERTDVRTALLLMSVGVITSAIIGWLSPLRQHASAVARTDAPS